MPRSSAEICASVLLRLRHFFEVDRRWITVKALKALVDAGQLPAQRVSEAMKIFGIKSGKPDPWSV